MDKDRPDILFPPPLGWLIALILSFALDRWLPIGLMPAYPWMPGIVTGVVILVFAIYTNIGGFLAFRRAGTNVNPYRPALRVVTDGPFRYTRNPMYLGMVTSILSLALLFSNLWALILAACLWAVLHHGVVRREERYMEARFGEDYRALLATTRRWL